MIRNVTRFGALFLACALAVACGKDKQLADAAIKAADDAVASAGDDVAKFAADQWKGVTDSLTAAKDAFAKGDYKTALAGANDVVAKVKDVVAAASAKKDELTKSWTDLSASLPTMVDAVKSRVESLSAARKLPAGLDKTKLEGAKSGLAAATQAWSEAAEAAKSGNLADAIAKANAVKGRLTEVMQSLGMSAAAPAAPAATK